MASSRRYVVGVKDCDRRLEPLEPRRLFAAVAVAPLLRALTPAISPNASLFESVSAIARSRRAAIADAAQAVDASALTAFTIDMAGLQRTLSAAPREFTRAAGSGAIELALPMPDGSTQRFSVVATQLMDPLLAARFKSIRAFVGIGLDDPSATVRLDYTPLGFHAQVLSPTTGAVHIEPYFQNDAAGTYASYFRRDTARATGAAYDFDLGNRAETSARSSFASSAARTSGAAARTYAGQLRTYRTAIAATGEYTRAVGGGTVSGGLAAIVTALNRVTGIYESELGIRLQLVANNDKIVYTNPNTDPYTNSSGVTMLGQNIHNLDSVIGNSKFDIGHVFSTGGGGVAYLGVVGDDTQKAAGVTGLGNPQGDAFYVDYVAHEMGHQFGADHTFNTSKDPNRAPSTAYEPGSGSTIMSYAGLEGVDNLQAHADPYFHSASIDQIRDYIATIPSVGTKTTNGNVAPVVSAGPSYTIPARTPFALTATGSDANGDRVTYDWQERDLGDATNIGVDNGFSPIERVWTPSTNPTRTVPRLSDLLNNTLSLGEMLPAASRSAFNWRVVARDNKGGVSTSDVRYRIVNTGAAFAITSQNSGGTFTGGSQQTVTWNVAGTTGNGINAASVTILLSTDGGLTYPAVLTNSTANDGSASITLPKINSSTARLRVQPTNNVFFDVSNANFTIRSQSVAPFAVLSNGQLIVNGTDSADTIRLTLSGSNLLARRGSSTLTFSASKVTGIVVNAIGGNDVVTNSTGKPSRLLGGAGNDSLTGGSGDDVLIGGTGNDSLDGGDNNDTFFARNNPADADQIAGGTGTDRLQKDSIDSSTSIESLLA